MATPDVDEQRKKIQKIRKEAAAAQSANFSRIMNLDVKVDKDGTRATVILPGLSYDDFDRTGNPVMWKISPRINYWAGNSLPLSKLVPYSDSGSMMTFALWQDIELKPKLYEQNSLPAYYPIQLHYNLAAVGHTSCMVSANVSCIDTGNPLISERSAYVYVNKSTRKPVPHSKSTKTKLEKAIGQNKMPRFPQMEPLPQAVFSYEVVPGPSDIDRNFHINRASYIRYVMNCATHACKANYYTLYKGDIGKYKIRYFRILYRKESQLDRFVVRSWESSVQLNKIFFHILRGDRVLADCIIEFYPAFQSRY